MAVVSRGSAAPEVPAPLIAILRDRGLARRWTGRRIALFATPDLSVRKFDSATGAIVGTVFNEDGQPAPSVLPIAIPPDWHGFARRYWGSYVGCAETAESALLARDPSGGMPCYLAERDGALLATTLPHLLADSGLVPTAIDWAEICAFLMNRDTRLASTALHGVLELMPGTALERPEIGPAQVKPIWHAKDFAQPSAQHPADSLRQAFDMTLAAWARTATRPLVEVSGGLDSAIVAAGFAAAAPSASLITFAAADGDPDERLYAAALADRLGLDLHVVCPRVEAIDLTRSTARNLPRPTARSFTQAADLCSLEYARSIGADLFASGGGGDDVFCYLRGIGPVIDRARAEGLRAAAATAVDVARTTHATVWEVIGRLARRNAIPAATSIADTRFLNADAVAPFCRDMSIDETGIPPGKAAHIRHVASIHNHLEGHARAAHAPVLSPLVSQPIVETCLAIPSWHWCEGGINRAVARQACAGRLPRLLLDRRSKGSFEGFCAMLFETNRRLIGDMLLGGRLNGHGLLDSAGIAAALAMPFPPSEVMTRLLELVDIEAWVASVRNR